MHELPASYTDHLLYLIYLPSEVIKYKCLLVADTKDLPSDHGRATAQAVSF